MLLCSFYLKLFAFTLKALSRSECQLAVSTERVFQNCSIKGKIHLCYLNAQNRKKFHRMLPCSFYLEIFLFPLQAPQRSECPLAVSTKRVFQNSSITIKVQLCQLNVQIRKKFHRMLLCTFYLQIQHFPLQALQRSPCQLEVSTERVFQNCSIIRQIQLCQLNAQNRKEFHRMLLCSFYLKIFHFPLQASQSSECPLAVSTEGVFQNC